VRVLFEVCSPCEETDFEPYLEPRRCPSCGVKFIFDYGDAEMPNARSTWIYQSFSISITGQYLEGGTIQLPLKNYRNDMRGKLPKLGWGRQVVGTLILECDRCGAVWKKQVDKEDNEVICEGMGEECPACGRITTNWCLDVRPLQTMEDWY
jgi:hypothetical protein